MEIIDHQEVNLRTYIENMYNINISTENGILVFPSGVKIHVASANELHPDPRKGPYCFYGLYKNIYEYSRINYPSRILKP